MPSPPETARVIAMIAAHNRRDLTLQALRRFAASARRAGAEPRLVLVDDGSTDGTVDAVLSSAPCPVDVVRGDGHWFWARSMAEGEARALADARDHDFLLWLNDDVVLADDAVGHLLDCAAQAPGHPIIGPTREPGGTRTTYGGMRRSRPHPLSLDLISPDPAGLTALDAFNGNIVLVRADLARELGGIDGGFAHGLADLDYGLRAARRGHAAMLCPRPLGECARNAPKEYATLGEAWRAYVSIKGGAHPRSTARLLRRGAPWTWPLWWTATYAKWWIDRRAAVRGARVLNP